MSRKQARESHWLPPGRAGRCCQCLLRELRMPPNSHPPLANSGAQGTGVRILASWLGLRRCALGR
jgi:hypothetical protein